MRISAKLYNDVSDYIPDIVKKIEVMFPGVKLTRIFYATRTLWYECDYDAVQDLEATKMFTSVVKLK